MNPVDNVTPIRFRHWFAISLALPLATCLATVGVMSIPASRGNIDLTAGRDVFRARCGSCHFAKAGFPAHHGPNLYQIGRTAALRKPDTTASQYILESILKPDAFIAPSSRPGMPTNTVADMSPDSIRNLVAFLASCGAFPDYDDVMSLEIPDMRGHQRERIPVRLQDMELAERVLRDKGHCLECHGLHSHPEYKVFAPGLFGVGLRDRQLIEESIIEPNKVVSPVYRSANVWLESGIVISGRLLSRTDDRLVLLTRDEDSRLVRREILISEVDQEEGQPMIMESKVSLMPSGFDQILTREEINALSTLIRQLN